MFDLKRRRQMGVGLVAIVATVLSLGLISSASAGKHSRDADCDNQRRGHGVPTNRISIQEWTFAEYIGFGTDAATVARLEEVIEFLSDTGYRNIELFTLSGLTAEQMRALLDEYGLEASSRHVNVGTPEAPVDFEQILEENQTLGIRYFGSGGTQNYETEAEWVAYAEYLNDLGRQARRVGQRLMVHNHNWEFERVFGDRSAFDILVEHTNRRNVYFQVDLYWAVRGLGVANGLTSIDAADDLAADLIEELGNRVRLAHVKDMSSTIAAPADPPAASVFPGRIEIVGEGGIDFPSLFDATSIPLRYYVVEHDPRFGDPTFDPFDAAEAGFKYLTCVRY